MIRLWEPIIRPLLSAADPRAIVQVGAGRGELTLHLLRLATETGARLHVIDHQPDFDFQALHQEFGGRSEFYVELSLNVLGRMPAVDAALLDGDHNWYTVLHELELLYRRSSAAERAFPLVLVHDVGWPYGRRDAYLDPDAIPVGHRQPTVTGGLSLGASEPTPQTGLHQHIEHSIYEHDVRNGVLTAVEDFVRAHTSLSLITLPGLFGIAIVVDDRRRTECPDLAQALSRLTSTDFLRSYVEVIEESRITHLLESEAAHRELTLLAEQKQERSAALVRLESQFADARKRESTLGADLERAREDHSTAEARAGALETQAKAVIASADRADAEVKALREANDESRREISQLHARTEVLANRTVELEEAHQGALKAIVAGHEVERQWSQELAAATRQLVERETEATHLESSLAASSAELADARDERNQLLHQLTKQQAQSADLQRRLAAAQADLARTRHGLGKTTRLALELEGTVGGLRDQLHLLQDEMDSAGAEGERQSQEIAAMERELLKREVESSDLRQARDDARNSQARAEGSQERARAELDSGRAENARLRELIEEQQSRLTSEATLIASLREDADRLARSRAWRVGHALMVLASRLTRRRMVTAGAPAAMLARLEVWEQEVRPGSGTGPALLASSAPALAIPARVPPAESPGGERVGVEPSAKEIAAFADDLRGRLGQPPRRRRWPRVSVIVLNRNGVNHLRHLLAGLAHRTDYPALEVVVVDNASSDGSLEVLDDYATRLDLRIVRNDHNATFSEGNNQGAALARGPLLLFLNNDIEPFEPAWLKEMVSARHRVRAHAIGATLVYRRRRMHDTPSGWSVQHRGIRFRRQDGGLKGFNLDMGSDPLDARLGEAVDCPAVTAACLLLHADDFKAVGGFTLGYRYGTEDIDLGLKLLASDRRLISCGRAVLLHDESATQEAEGREFMRLNRLGNRELFLQRWGPQLRREFLLDAFTGRGFWTVPGSPHVGITLTSAAVESGWGDWYTAHELGDALERLGWRVSYLQRKGDGWYAPPADLDATICLMDVFDASRNDVGIVVAWIRNWTERWLTRPWFDHLDVLLPSSRRSAELIEESGRARSAAIMPLATNPGRFHPAANNAVPSDYVFTGNFWGARRDIVDALQVREDETFRVFGKDWGQVPEFAAYWAGMSDYEDLPGVYASAKLVLDDTAGPTLPYGAVNCRVFDALAAGTLVITNCDTGVRELFDDEFPTWRDGQDLRTRIDELLRDESRRRELAARYRLMVLQSHTYGHRAEQIRDVLIEHVEALRFCLKIGAPDRARAERWGDTHFARALAKQLRRRGHSTIIQTLDEWEDPAGMDHDVVVHLKGLSPYRPKPGQFNVLWVISHPELITADECDLYDLVCVASERFASDLARRATAPVVCLQQATDPDIFFPDPVAEHGRELVFVGNSRKVRRQILDDLLPTERELAVFGSDWEGLLDPRHLAGEYVPNDAVRTLYSSAAIVLNDHWRDMREHGFVSNRVFDVLACGGTVLSDDLPELGDLFGDAVVSYRSKEDLNESIDRLLTSRQEREERGRRGRELVLAHHTFSHRADELLELVLATMKKRDYSTRVLAEGSSAARPVASEASA